MFLLVQFRFKLAYRKFRIYKDLLYEVFSDYIVTFAFLLKIMTYIELEITRVWLNNVRLKYSSLHLG